MSQTNRFGIVQEVPSLDISFETVNRNVNRFKKRDANSCGYFPLGKEITTEGAKFLSNSFETASWKCSKFLTISSRKQHQEIIEILSTFWKSTARLMWRNSMRLEEEIWKSTTVLPSSTISERKQEKTTTIMFWNTMVIEEIQSVELQIHSWHYCNSV